MKRGKDYIGVGVGAMVFNQKGLVFLAKRSKGSRNEPETWEFPGGAVEFGEKLEDALIREFYEEYGLKIKPIELLCITDHIIDKERQHWVSPTFIAIWISGNGVIREPNKCSEIGWFELSTLPEPLMTVSRHDIEQYKLRFGLQPYKHGDGCNAKN